METQSPCVAQFRWWSLLAVAGGGLFVGACAEHHHDDLNQREQQRVTIQDETGNRHEGYYDERHTWHGGYYDSGRQFHRDPEDWRHDAVVVEHPELRRNDAGRTGERIEGRDERSIDRPRDYDDRR